MTELIDHGAEVAALETMGGQITLENDDIQIPRCHALPPGSTVTNRVASSPVRSEEASLEPAYRMHLGEQVAPQLRLVNHGQPRVRQQHAAILSGLDDTWLTNA